MKEVYNGLSSHPYEPMIDEVLEVDLWYVRRTQLSFIPLRSAGRSSLIVTWPLHSPPAGHLLDEGYIENPFSIRRPVFFAVLK